MTMTEQCRMYSRIILIWERAITDIVPGRPHSQNRKIDGLMNLSIALARRKTPSMDCDKETILST